MTPNSTAEATIAATQAMANRCPRPASDTGACACTAIAARPAHAPAAARPHVKMTNLSTGPRRSDSIAPSPTIAAAAGPKRTAAITSGMSEPDSSTRVEILTVRDSATYATTPRIRTDSHRPIAMRKGAVKDKPQRRGRKNGCVRPDCPSGIWGGNMYRSYR